MIKAYIEFKEKMIGFSKCGMKPSLWMNWTDHHPFKLMH